VLSLYLYAWTALAPLGSILIAWLCAASGTTLAFAVVGGAGLVACVLTEWRLRSAGSPRPAPRLDPARLPAA
jgi:hypothetical protein